MKSLFSKLLRPENTNTSAELNDCGSLYDWKLCLEIRIAFVPCWILTFHPLSTGIVSNMCTYMFNKKNVGTHILNKVSMTKKNIVTKMHTSIDQDILCIITRLEFSTVRKWNLDFVKSRKKAALKQQKCRRERRWHDRVGLKKKKKSRNQPQQLHYQYNWY